MIAPLLIIIVIICILDISKMKSEKSNFKDYLIFFILITVTVSFGIFYSLNPNSKGLSKIFLDALNINY